jgi:hypothetical protein
VEVEGLAEFHAELRAKQYRYLKPGIRTEPWGRSVTVLDPFHNRLIFNERAPADGG